MKSVPLRASFAATVLIAVTTSAGACRGPKPPSPAAGVEASASFDHAIFDGVLQRRVDERGRVDYAGLARDPAALDRYVDSLATAPIEELPRDEMLTLLINAYNAFTLRLILDHWNDGALTSIRDIDDPWGRVRWTIGGRAWSLNQIEHEWIRPTFEEPRIHFALVCAAIGCPPLRREAYRPDRLDRQLETQTGLVHGDPRWCRFDADAGVLHLTKLYDWYGGDFEQAAGSVRAYVARYRPALESALADDRKPRIEWIDYDWSLNAQGR